MRKKKLLHIVEAMGGGVFTYIVELSNQLVEKYDIYIAYATRPQTPENFRDYFDDRIKLIEVENFSRSVNALSDVKAFFEIKNIVKKINPDVVHLHSSKAGALGRWCINGRKIPMFYTPHGFSFLMADQSKLKLKIYKFIEKFCAIRQCTTIACSKGEYIEAKSLNKKATYVNNGINIKELENTIETIQKKNSDNFTVFTLGRICYQKNPELFNNIAKSMPNVKFLWIGDGELRNKLTSENIEITGWADRETALKYALSADVFMLTSLWEGLPMSLLEAMYMEKLCIVSKVIGNKDVIKTSYNGFCCENKENFIEAINYAKEKDCSQLISNSRNEVLSQYNTEVMAKKYDELYCKAIDNFSRSKKDH